MTLPILSLAAFVLAAFLLWLAIRSFQRERVVLYILIPIILIASLYTWHVINSLLGYATDDLSDLSERFLYISHVGQEPTFLLAVPQGAEEPRLYRIPSLSEEDRRRFGEASEKSKKGIPMIGTFAEGLWEMHQFEVDRILPKEG